MVVVASYVVVCVCVGGGYVCLCVFVCCVSCSRYRFCVRGVRGIRTQRNGTERMHIQQVDSLGTTTLAGIEAGVGVCRGHTRAADEAMRACKAAAALHAGTAAGADGVGRMEVSARDRCA